MSHTKDEQFMGLNRARKGGTRLGRPRVPVDAAEVGRLRAQGRTKNRFVLTFAAFLPFASVALFAQNGQSGQSELPMAGIHWARGKAPGHAGAAASSSPNCPLRNKRLSSGFAIATATR